MTTYEKAVMLTGQFGTVLIHDPAVTQGTVEVRAAEIAINHADMPPPPKRKKRG